MENEVEQETAMTDSDQQRIEEGKYSSSSFSRLFHEILHDGTTSNAQHYELNRSRPVDMLKLDILSH